jgi:hypothetical protein
MADGQATDLAARLGPFLRAAGDAIAKRDPPGLVPRTVFCLARFRELPPHLHWREHAD